MRFEGGGIGQVGFYPIVGSDRVVQDLVGFELPIQPPTQLMKTIQHLLIAGSLLLASVVSTQAAVSLGTAANFGVLAGSTVTNTGATVVTGDIGVHPGTAITGFFGTAENDGPGTFTGSVHQGDATANQAKIDADSAFTDLNNLAVTTTLGVELGGMTLTPGVYSLGSAGLTGILTLDGIGDYVFQLGTTLITAGTSAIELINGADASGVFWAVGSSATLGEDTDFAGTIIASESITLNDGASVDGRLIALDGAVTLINNNIVPEPSSISIVAILSLGLLVHRRRCAR